MKKLHMAFVDLCNFTDWPMGGMLQYERRILEILTKHFIVDLWGVSVDGIIPSPLMISGEAFPIHIFANAKRGCRLLPNFWRGMFLGRYKKELSQYDLIYLHTGSCAVAAALFMKTKTNLLVYHQHGLTYLADTSLKTVLQRPFMSMAQKMADFSFVVTGQEELENYLSSGREALRSRLVAIGSPTAYSSPVFQMPDKSETDCVFLYVGRLAPIKRVPFLIELFAQFCRQRAASCRLDIVGDGEERKAVERAITQNGVEKQVRLIGSVPAAEVSRYLSGADVFVTASAGEGMSLAVLEAFSAGLPVVCFPVPGLREQVKDGETGAVAESENASDFVSAIERAFSRRHEMTERCRDEGRKYSKEAIGAQIVKEIEHRYEQNHGCHSGL